MPPSLTFSEDVFSLDENGILEKTCLSTKSRKRKKTPFPKIKIKYTYNQQQARCVARRMEIELKNPKLLVFRQQEELIVENLLAHHNFYTKINRVYRLSNNALIVLKKKLIFN
jgi:hypothetical protein